MINAALFLGILAVSIVGGASIGRDARKSAEGMTTYLARGRRR